MEVGVATFRMVLRYENPSVSESSEFSAEDESEAASVCSEAVERHNRRLSELESRNVFVSKRACGCEFEALEDHI